MQGGATRDTKRVWRLGLSRATKKERKMTNKMTVADLIEILSKVDPTLPVKMSMNMEYESYVDSDMVGVRDYDNGPRLYISDTLDAYED
jgi:hypothetical protein